MLPPASRGLLQRLLPLLAAAGSARCAAPRTLALDGTWQLRNGTLHVPAAVPGTVPGALFAAGVAPDPQFGRNQLDVFHAAAAQTWTYSRSFTAPGCSAAAAHQRCELVFAGIDTAATVRVNGVTVGQANDMHLRWVFDVTKQLQQAQPPHTVEVEIQPATEYARAQAVANGDPNCTKHTCNFWPQKWGHGTECSGYIRKNTGSFGWDCAPAYMTAGIWKSVTLRVIEGAAIDMVAPQIRGKVNPEQPEASNSFQVEVRAFIVAASACTGKLHASGGWSGDATASTQVRLRPSTAEAPQLVTLTLDAKDVKLCRRRCAPLSIGRACHLR